VSQLNDDPERWRRRAAEMRIIANAMTGMVRAKESLLRIAEEYERKARQAEGRLGGRASGRLAHREEDGLQSQATGAVGLAGKTHQRSPEG
jgi:hypothetical protein